MKRLGFFGLSIFVSVFVLAVALAKAKVTGLYVYRDHVFVEESFAVKAGENQLFLAGAPRAADLTCGIKQGALKISYLHVHKVKAQGPLYQRLQALQEKLRALELKDKTLTQELELLRGMLKAPREIPSPETYQRYMDLLADYLQKKAQIEQEKDALTQEVASLKKTLGGGEVDLLEVGLEGQGQGLLLVRYPADQLVSIKEIYQVSLNTSQGLVEVKGQALVQQFSGRDWAQVTLYFYPRAQGGRVLNPPPFYPWVLGGPGPSWRTLALKAKDKGLARMGAPQRERASTGVWERVKVPAAELPAGKKVLIDLGRATFPAQPVLEVPVYAVNRAYFKTEIIPPISLPPLRARVYRDGLYLGETRLPVFVPGKKVTLYFGPAPLLEVKRQVLKDTTGKPFFHRGREVTEKVFRTVLLNHYDRSFAVEVIDRIPVSKRKEIQVKAEALPHWQELSPEGKVIWRFNMPPNSTKEIRLQIQINQPARR